MHYTVSILCNRGQVGVVYFDLSKTFDLVDAVILLSELQNVCVQRRLPGRFGSYVPSRGSSVKIREAYLYSH